MGQLSESDMRLHAQLVQQLVLDRVYRTGGWEDYAQPAHLLKCKALDQIRLFAEEGEAARQAVGPGPMKGQLQRERWA